MEGNGASVASEARARNAHVWRRGGLTKDILTDCARACDSESFVLQGRREATLSEDSTSVSVR